jgi:hypothetical protein
VRGLVADRARVLSVQRTGWGKSPVYFLPTALLRERGAGPAPIVSPLLVLMRNQIAAGGRLGIRAHTIDSTNRAAWEKVSAPLAQDSMDLVLIGPERPNTPRDAAGAVAERVGLLVLVVDGSAPELRHHLAQHAQRRAPLHARVRRLDGRHVEDPELARPRERCAQLVAGERLGQVDERP